MSDDIELVLTFQAHIKASDPDAGFARQDSLAMLLMAEDDVMATWMPTPRVSGHEQIVLDRDDAWFLLGTWKADLATWDDPEDLDTPNYLRQRIEWLERQLDGSVEVVSE